MYAADMIQRKAARLRLHPTPAQAAQLAQITAACRFVYNLGLEQRRDWYRLGHKFTFASRCRELTLLSAQEDWLRAVPVHPLQQALRDLERAYRNWREGRARAPTPRGKSINDSFRCPDPISLEVERTSKSSGRIKLPKLTLRERNWRELPGKICNVTISRRVGQWFAAVQCEREIPDPARCALSAVGTTWALRPSPHWATAPASRPPATAAATGARQSAAWHICSSGWRMPARIFSTRGPRPATARLLWRHCRCAA
jgi:putative transposase